MSLTVNTRSSEGLTKCIVCAAMMHPRPVGAEPMLVCSGCGMGRVPQMEPSSDYWTLGEGTEGEASKDYWIRARQRMFRSALRHLSRDGETGRLMDIGGGIGYFAQCALETGWDAYSVDVSDLAVKTAAERLGPSRSLSPHQTTSLVGTFDIVSLWCVIAHVADPSALLRQAFDLLRPGGRLVFTTPNFVFQANFARLIWRFGREYNLASQDHLLHFTPASLRMLLAKAGFGDWSLRYLGVTEGCIFEPRLASFLVPVKRAWNWSTTRAAALGLPALSAELQVVAKKPVS